MAHYRLQTTVGGKPRGMAITGRDRAFLEWVARWYSLTDDHLGRMDLGWQAWWTMLANDQTKDPAQMLPMPDGSAPRRASNYRSNVRRRMTAMEGLSVPGSDEGLVTRMASWKAGDVTTGWWLTRAGRDYLDAPYAIATSPSTLKAQHTWDAADLGYQLESMFSLTVMSEREVMAGQTFRDGETTEVPVTLFQARRKGGEHTRSKRPDLAILHEGDGGRLSFTAVEVERVTSRPLREYKEKLLAYAEAPEVDAVWYLCDRRSVRDRVRRAWQELVATGEVIDDGTTPLLVETEQHWGEQTREQKRDGYLRRRVDWVGLPGIGLDGSILPDSKGNPSKTGTRMMTAIRVEQAAQGVRAANSMED